MGPGGMAFYVYIVTNRRNGTLYIGHTDDIERRAYQHRVGAFTGFASKYRCTRLVWFGQFPTRDEALARERQMKAWKRNWKIALIEQENPGWRDLTDDWHPIGARHYRMGYHPAAMDPDCRQEVGNCETNTPTPPPPQQTLGSMAAGRNTPGSNR